MQATTDPRGLAGDLYALLVYLHKDCTADLFEALGALELTISQTKLLQKLEHVDGEVTLKHVGELLGLSLPAASRAVDDLVRRGMVERHEDTEDRRCKRVRLTEPGSAAIRQLNAARLNDLEQFTTTLTDGERGTLVAALDQLLRRPAIAVCRPEETL
ncbi:MAG: MarR family winged helix-turn-helix transcriptional regulator [Solirubrobacteraceae bacterium]